jgi:hypothetical protein
MATNIKMAVFYTHRPDDEAVSTSKTSVNIYQTTLSNIPEDKHLTEGHCQNPTQACAQINASGK